ncbi:MAG: SURF1 family protein [Methylophilus sp.]|nr:SURF1 family protein [Methylophilus sp.]
MQFKFMKYQFDFNWLSTLIVIVCIPVFIKLGLWQYNKAALRQSIQDQYQSSLVKQKAALANHLASPEVLQFQQATVAGQYETQYQVLIDNQVENSQAGFHVVTPFKIAGTDQYVLVNRGWIAGTADHQAVPAFNTPTESLEISGMVWLPLDKIFTLESKSNSVDIGKQAWQLVWQHLDMKKYRQLAPIDMLDVIIKLDPADKGGGFVRNWQMPPSKIMTNLGYAYQWFGFAFATLAIYLYTGVRRIKTEE